MCDAGHSVGQSVSRGLSLVSRRRRRRAALREHSRMWSRLGRSDASCDWELPLRLRDSPPYLQLALQSAAL